MPLYGLLVGISCIAAVLLISAIHSYSTLQARVSSLAYSYMTIVKLEAFQSVLSGHQNVSPSIVRTAAIDQLTVYGSGGVFVIRSKSNGGIYSVT